LKLIAIGIILILIAVVLSGCNEQTTINENSEDEISSSDLTEPIILDCSHEHNLGGILGDKIRIFGIIKNTASESIEDVFLEVVFLDASNNIIESSIIDTKPSIINTGETACFYDNIYDISFFDHYELTVSTYRKSINKPYLDLKIHLQGEPILEYTYDFAEYEINGNIVNTGSEVIKDIRIWAILYDSNNNLIDIGFSSQIDILYSGQMESFQIYVFRLDGEAYELSKVVDYEFKVEYNYAS
jgi:hypothetical protein